jgi:predicted nucleic acid-binding protein
MNVMHAVPGLGHNSGDPADLGLGVADFLQPGAIRALLELNHADVLQRRDDMEDAFGNFCEKFDVDGKLRIPDEETAGKATDFAKMLKACLSAMDAARKLEKKPFDEAGATVQNFFTKKMKALQIALDAVSMALLNYGREKQAREQALIDAARRKAEEEARAARAAAAAEAARAAASERPPEPDLLAAAAAATTEAAQAQRQGAQRVSEAGRTRGDHGAVATVAISYKAEVIDFDLLPREYMMPDMSKIEAAMRGSRQREQGVLGAPTIVIPGVVFNKVEGARIR